MSDRISDISHSGNPYVCGNLCVHTLPSSRIGILVPKLPWHPLEVRERVVGKASIITASVILPMIKFHEEYRTKRRNRVIMMDPVTLKATVNWTPANSSEADVPCVP